MHLFSPYPLHRSDELIVGGTNLLDEFFGVLSEGHGPGRLMIASAFMTSSILDRFAGLDHADLTLDVITRPGASASAAATVAAEFPWQLAETRTLRALHAKLFVFLRDDLSWAFVIGSHNLTRAGATTNNEVGVLFRTTRPTDSNSSLFTAIDRFEMIRSAAQPFNLNH
jgi:phosphatidylserine/phosphatidylglycerophosphate/cardiolipin synthase-like enzyme